MYMEYENLYLATIEDTISGYSWCRLVIAESSQEAYHKTVDVYDSIDVIITIQSAIN